MNESVLKAYHKLRYRCIEDGVQECPDQLWNWFVQQEIKLLLVELGFEIMGDK